MLKRDAVPSVQLCSQSTPRPTLLATPSARRHRQEKEAENQLEAFIAGETITDIDDLYKKLIKQQLPTGFRYVKIKN